MTSALLILGAGGHGRVVAELAAQVLGAEILFLDDDLSKPGVIGPLSQCHEPCLRQRAAAAVVALGQARLRLQWLQSLQQLGYPCPPLVHSMAWVSATAELGPGTVVLPQAVVMAGARLGAGCIVNTSASVDHDCRLDDGVHICPGAHLAGEVQVGPCSWIGIGASVIQGIAIGADVTVGAGGAVVHDLAAGLTVVGVPARPLGQSS
jgi:sugar O-acyltransferase (sialic acid O-acetyltransferase NeuD family)